MRTCWCRGTGRCAVTFQENISTKDDQFFWHAARDLWELPPGHLYLLSYLYTLIPTQCDLWLFHFLWTFCSLFLLICYDIDTASVLTWCLWFTSKPGYQCIIVLSTQQPAYLHNLISYHQPSRSLRSSSQSPARSQGKNRFWTSCFLRKSGTIYLPPLKSHHHLTPSVVTWKHTILSLYNFLTTLQLSCTSDLILLTLMHY